MDVSSLYAKSHLSAFKSAGPSPTTNEPHSKSFALESSQSYPFIFQQLFL